MISIDDIGNLVRRKTLISNIIPSGLIIGIMNILGNIGRLTPGVAGKHLACNRLAYSESMGSFREGYIENQNELRNLFYGQAKGRLTRAIVKGYINDDGSISASFNSCEIIACYNAYSYLGREVPLPELIESFEREGTCLGGAFGSTIKSMLRSITRQGFTYRLCKLQGKRSERNINRIKAMAETYSCFILMMWNDGSLRGGIHTVCITRTMSGWCLHNPFGEKDTLIDALFSYYNADMKCFIKPIALIGIK